MKKFVTLLLVVLLLLYVPCGALAEISVEEQEYYYYAMEALVYDIGNRYMTLDGQAEAMAYLAQECRTLGCSASNGTLLLDAVKGLDSNDDTFYSSNVIGIRKAQNSDPHIIILCAHYDSKGPGARDNASGVAGVLLFLRRFYQMEPYENTELRFVAFTAEETGHQGSVTYVQGLPPAERDRIIAVFNLDIIVVDEWAEDYCLACDTLGGRTADGYTNGHTDAPVENSVSRAFEQAIADLDAFAPEDNGILYAIRHKGSSDHDAFHLAEIDAANISFRGNSNTAGLWTDLIHTQSDLIGDFDWDRTWQTLDIVYTAVDGLARDAGYGVESK